VRKGYLGITDYVTPAKTPAKRGRDDKIPAMGFYQRLLEERDRRLPTSGHPMLRHFIERGVHSPGEGLWFKSLQFRFPEEYRRLLEEKYQENLFQGRT
jgi:hypothetical protein